MSLNPHLEKALIRIDRCQAALEKTVTHSEHRRAVAALRSAERAAIRVWILVDPEGKEIRMRYLQSPISFELEATVGIHKLLRKTKLTSTKGNQ